jgi:hypothetical protein
MPGTGAIPDPVLVNRHYRKGWTGADGSSSAYLVRPCSNRYRVAGIRRLLGVHGGASLTDQLERNPVERVLRVLFQAEIKVFYSAGAESGDSVVVLNPRVVIHYYLLTCVGGYRYSRRRANAVTNRDKAPCADNAATSVRPKEMSAFTKDKRTGIIATVPAVPMSTPTRAMIVAGRHASIRARRPPTTWAPCVIGW